MKEELWLKGGWVQVNIYAPTYAIPHKCAGYIYCHPGRRLLDQLNEVFPFAVPDAREFIPIREGKMYSLREGSEAVEFACLNKVNILFVGEFEDGQTRGVGSKPGDKRYPYLHKSPRAVKLYLPFYIMTGNIHCSEGQRVSDVLNLPLRFFPITDVEIHPEAGNDLKSGFVAVNKRQIILLEETVVPTT